MTADPSKPIEQWQAFDVKDPNTMKIEFARGELEPEMPYYVKVAAIGPEGEGVSSESIPFDTVSGGKHSLIYLPQVTDFIAKLPMKDFGNKASWCSEKKI